MLGKLFKYDMAALSRTLLPLHAAVLAFIVIGCVAGFSGHEIGASSTSGMYTPRTTLQLIALFSMLALAVSMVATFVLILLRFYRNLFTDEGYLTLTLPVTANRILLSKVLAGLLWTFVNGALAIVGVVLISLSIYGFSNTAIENTAVYWVLCIASGNLTGLGGWGSVLLAVVDAASQAAFGMLLAYLSLVLGARLARHHKVAAGIGMYLLIGWVVGLVKSIAAVVAARSVFYSTLNSSLSYDTTSFFSSVAGVVLTIVLAVACYVWCACLLKKAELA